MLYINKKRKIHENREKNSDTEIELAFCKTCALVIKRN